MGPQLLLDKSSLQSLSYGETLCARRHYYMVYAPIIFIEILGDLKKHAGDIERSTQLAGVIANKIQPGNSCFNAHFRTLLIANLLGKFIENAGRPIMVGGQDVVDSIGRTGIVFEEEPEREALRRWVNGDIHNAEFILSQRWRESTRLIDLESWRRAEINGPIPSTLKEVKEKALSICNDPSICLDNLRFLLREAGVPEHESKKIFMYWVSRGKPPIQNFAPYAYYCLVVYVTFYLGLASKLIGTRPTNRVDLEYILYLPFCRVFASNDNFHADFAPLFIKEEQDFINGQDLKMDIKRIDEFWTSMSQSERHDYEKSNGRYPPDWNNSITNLIWKKHMRPRSEYKPLTLSPDEEDKLMAQVRPMLEAFENTRKQRD